MDEYMEGPEEFFAKQTIFEDNQRLKRQRSPCTVRLPMQKTYVKKIICGPDGTTTTTTIKTVKHTSAPLASDDYDENYLSPPAHDECMRPQESAVGLGLPPRNFTKLPNQPPPGKHTGGSYHAPPPTYNLPPYCPPTFSRAQVESVSSGDIPMHHKEQRTHSFRMYAPPTTPPHIDQGIPFTERKTRFAKSEMLHGELTSPHIFTVTAAARPGNFGYDGASSDDADVNSYRVDVYNHIPVQLSQFEPVAVNRFVDRQLTNENGMDLYSEEPPYYCHPDFAGSQCYFIK